MAYQKFLGITKEQVIGKTVFEIAPEDLANIYYRADEVLFLSKVLRFMRHRSCMQMGKGDIIFNKATYVGTNGCVAGLVGVILDITERKRVEEEMVIFHDRNGDRFFAGDRHGVRRVAAEIRD